MTKCHSRYTAFDSTKYHPGLYAKDGDNQYDAFEKDIGVVHFFFQVDFYPFRLTLLFQGTHSLPVPAGTADDLDRLHFPDGRPPWTLPWIQPHLR